jgi:hypothetical protein
MRLFIFGSYSDASDCTVFLVATIKKEKDEIPLYLIIFSVN